MLLALQRAKPLINTVNKMWRIRCSCLVIRQILIIFAQNLTGYMQWYS